MDEQDDKLQLIGKIALFRTENGDKAFIITKALSNTCVNGRVILDGMWDGYHGDLPRVGLDLHIASCIRGREVGQWHFREDE